MNKILLVDDDRELTSLLKELLEMEGFNVIVAHDGEQALDLLDDSIEHFARHTRRLSLC